jgi:hypothetical protein
LSDIKRQPIEWDKMKPVMKSILNNNNSMVQTVDFKAKTEEPDGNIGDNIVESLKDSETLDKT